MNRTLPLALVAALAGTGAALADDDCRRPMSDWQPREAAAAHVAGLGIIAYRLGIDDGCYEVRGRDGDGNRVELTLDPATLALLELEVKFAATADPARYLPRALRQQPAAGN